ncbi:DNA repair-scaffolding protein isoform X3 [Diceros bicornis minor]|uniref:DNA repair-scaffolding protein isoform X3 n=1 Tax=Diceros bicornis minor TaxID=77932 RepID=UPI0026F292E1|nr:DNA repair-scaffolding protein isoform X3 [Diceros bicornis minor]
MSLLVHFAFSPKLSLHLSLRASVGEESEASCCSSVCIDQRLPEVSLYQCLGTEFVCREYCMSDTRMIAAVFVCLYCCEFPSQDRFCCIPYELRKRNWNIEYSSFPGESPLQFRRAGLRTVGADASLSEAWLRCGEGFQDTSGTPSLTAEKKTLTEKHLELSPRPKKETITSKSTSGLTDITWSSSGSDLSDEDKTLFKPQRDNGRSSTIDRFCNRNILCPEDEASEDELQLIDWEVGSDREDTSECNEFEDGESAVEISDCASCASSHSLTSEERLSEFPKASSTEILEYSSDSEKEDDLENVLVIDSESSHEYHTDFESGGRQVMERLKKPRVKTTETILYTPQKQAEFPRTPENSAKKKKLLRGGLAERLNGLQNRERSAISLWRHQCVSYQKTLSGRKSGVLIVKILELHEECTIQVAMCEQLAGLQADSPQGEAAQTDLKVLFTKETALYLRGHPQDIVHIYPPWQKLIIPNGSCPVILNTYFCQKIVAKEDSKTTQEMHCWDTPRPRRNITLAQMFRFKSPTENSPESQVMCSGLTAMGTDWTHGDKEAKQHILAQAPLRDSLLDAVENQGAATWPGGGVRVVVQRVYSLPFTCQQGSGSAPSLGSDPPRVRICLLVQDAYGMFGEVYSEDTILKDRQLEGKCCSLAGMKVLQKATRGRTAGLFSLIDIMWPPVIALKAPGHRQACEEVKTHLPPPSFCYILTAHPNLGQIDIIEEDPVSKLYQPPIPCSLRGILQTDDLSTRCSFYARVIYQRPQLNSLLLREQREIWLMVTDVTLQVQDENNSGLPKTIPVCVASSCVLDPEVLEALAEAAPHSFLFRDAVRDQGRIVCVERTVLLLQKPPLGVASGARSCELTGPVTLDELDSVTQVNSICSVQGAVVGVDESTAFSWPTCDLCGNERLKQSPEDRGTFSCGDCSRVVTVPLLRRHLQVFLDCPSRPQCTVSVKLLQSSIASLLRFAACDDGVSPGTPSPDLRSEECPRKGGGVVKLFCPVHNHLSD